MKTAEILDQGAKTHDWEWLTSIFGAVEVEQPAVSSEIKGTYCLVKVQDVEGPAALIVNVAGADGKPLKGVQVVRSWADAPQLPAWPEPTSRWRDRGVYGPTDANGNLGFGMGSPDTYLPPAGGPASVWVADAAGPSEMVSGLGMLEASNHRHLDLYFQFQAAPEPPTPPTEPAPSPPSPPPSLALTDAQWKLLLEKLDLILAALEGKAQPKGEDQGSPRERAGNDANRTTTSPQAT